MTLSFLLLAAAAAGAPDGARSPNETVCKRTYLTTSRMGSSQKVCMTRAEWAERKRLSDKAAGDVKVSGSNRTNGGVSGEGLPTPPGASRGD